MTLRVQTIRIVECLNTSSEAFEVLKAPRESAEKENIFFAFLFDYWPIAERKIKIQPTDIHWNTEVGLS